MEREEPMMSTPLTDDDRSDEELLATYQGELDDDGRSLATIWHRHHRRVRTCLEAAGVVCPSEDQVGAVFLRALNRQDVDGSLKERLTREAQELAQDPDWTTR